MAVYYTEAALAAVESAFSSGFQAALTQAETDASLSAGDLPPPDDYLRAFLPGDDRHVMQIYSDEAMTPAEAGQRNRVWHVPVTVVFSFRHDAQPEAGDIKATRYLSAMNAVIVSKGTTGWSDPVVQAAIVESGHGYAENESATRKHIVLKLDVLVAW